MSVIPYRKEIDGLRAVAVLLVVLSHAQYSLFQGGFIGVDVFFVISGYLITSIMVAEVDKGVFSFKTFYLRRLRRILPALLAVLMVTSCAAYKMLMPNQLISYAKAQFAALASCANFFLWKFYGGYWRGSSKEFPLTHTWSLSVEEQFYFIWPILLVLAYTLISKRFHNKILVGVFVVLVGLSQYLVQFPEFAFYMIPARFYELFMGAMAALIFRSPIKFKSHLDKQMVSFIHILGICLILYSSFFFKEGLAYPGFNALIPCLGTILLLIPFTCKGSPVITVFSSSPLVAIGKISYSLYLWHWPIFSLLAYSGYSVEKYRIQALILSLILSVLSYRFVEQPFRKVNISLKKAFAYFVFLPLCLSGFFLYGAAGDGYIARYNSDERKAVKAVSMVGNPYLGAQLGKGSPTNSHIENVNTVWNNGSDRNAKALLIGDSHSTAIRPFVELMCEPLGLKGVQVSRDSTPFLLNVDFYDRDVFGKDILRKDKREMNDYWRKLAGDGNIKYVFIAAFYSSRIFSDHSDLERLVHDRLSSSSNTVEDNKKSFFLGFYDAVEFLVSRGVVPVIFKDVPYVKEPLSKNYVKNKIFNAKLTTSTEWQDVITRHEFEDSVIDRIKKSFPSVIVIDPKDVLHNLVVDGYYLPVLNGIPLYLDTNHLNRDGANELGKAWLSMFGNPLISANFNVKRN